MKFKPLYLILFLSSVFILQTALFTLRIPLDSDKTSNYLLVNDYSFLDKHYMPSDNFILKAPIFKLAMMLFSITPQAAFWSNMFFNMLLIIFFLIFYIHIYKKIAKNNHKGLIFFLPLIFFVLNTPLFFRFLSNSILRNFEFGIVCLFLIMINVYEEKIPVFLTKNKYVFSFILSFFVGFFLFNDPYFVFAFMAPLIYFLFLYWLLFKKPSYIYWGTVCMASLFFYFAIKTLMYKVGIFTVFDKIEFSSFTEMVSRAVEIWGNTFRFLNANFFDHKSFGLPMIVSFFRFLLLVIFLFPVYIFTQKKLLQKNPLLIFIVCIPLINIGIYIFSTLSSDLTSARYLMLVPIFMTVNSLLFLFIIRKNKKTFLFITLCIILGCVANIYQNVEYLKQFPKPNTSNYRLISLLQKKGLTKGYANYWFAPINTFLSGNQIKMRQVVCSHNKIIPYRWLINTKWFIPEYKKSFFHIEQNKNLSPKIISASCNLADLEKQFGPPEEKVIIDEKSFILIYPYDVGGNM